MNVKPISLVWLRRDLRLHDHAALFHALEHPGNVQLIFLFDEDVLSRFANPQDRRLTFIAATLYDIHARLVKKGSRLLVMHGKPAHIIPKLAEALNAAHVFAAEDYEPATIARDKAVAKLLGGKLTLVKDQHIFAPYEITKDNKEPYKVFTPFSKAWMARSSPSLYAPFPIRDEQRYADNNETIEAAQKAGLKLLFPEQGVKAMLYDIGYRETYLPLWPVKDAGERLTAFMAAKINGYATARDMVADEGTSRISPYLRFGLISPREALRLATEVGGAQKWINELIWREFYAMILYHYPESATTEWNPIYRGTLDWSNNQNHLEAWKAGKTGYPLVDAAMRELLETGWMHNRARMVVASFLTKDLQLDWRLGEEHFAQHLMDYDMASNVGGWQWAASTGTDAQPWFRIFNPTLQSQKFDPKGRYIRRYVKELKAVGDDAIHEPSGLLKPADYPNPIVDHGQQREKTLAMFKKAR